MLSQPQQIFLQLLNSKNTPPTGQNLGVILDSVLSWNFPHTIHYQVHQLISKIYLKPVIFSPSFFMPLLHAWSVMVTYLGFHLPFFLKSILHMIASMIFLKPKLDLISTLSKISNGCSLEMRMKSNLSMAWQAPHNLSLPAFLNETHPRIPHIHCAPLTLAFLFSP